MRAITRAAVVAALFAVVASPVASYASGPGGQCTLRFRQVTTEPLPGGLGQPYLDCTY